MLRSCLAAGSLPIWRHRLEEPMKLGTRLIRILSLVAVLGALAGAAHAQVPEFQKILDSYSKALDANDVESLVGLYSPNGVFMREDMKPVIGRDALRESYRYVF